MNTSNKNHVVASVTVLQICPSTSDRDATFVLDIYESGTTGGRCSLEFIGNPGLTILSQPRQLLLGTQHTKKDLASEKVALIRPAWLAGGRNHLEDRFANVELSCSLLLLSARDAITVALHGSRRAA